MRTYLHTYIENHVEIPSDELNTEKIHFHTYTLAPQKHSRTRIKATAQSQNLKTVITKQKSLFETYINQLFV